MTSSEIGAEIVGRAQMALREHSVTLLVGDGVGKLLISDVEISGPFALCSVMSRSTCLVRLEAIVGLIWDGKRDAVGP